MASNIPRPYHIAVDVMAVVMGAITARAAYERLGEGLTPTPHEGCH